MPQLLGIAIAGVFIWMAIDQVGPVKGVTGNDLAMVSVCLLVSAGILLVFSTCIGITAASVENYLLAVVVRSSCGRDDSCGRSKRE